MKLTLDHDTCEIQDLQDIFNHKGTSTIKKYFILKRIKNILTSCHDSICRIEDSFESEAMQKGLQGK